MCRECGGKTHTSALHPGPAPWSVEASAEQGEENEAYERPLETPPAITSKCTEICGNNTKAKSCCKICLVRVYPMDQPEKAIQTYAVLDDQSNRSLACSEFFDLFKLNETASPYTLKTCSGILETSERRATNFVVESYDGKTRIKLPTLIECEMIPDNRDEIPTPEIAHYYPHLRLVADKIPPLNASAHILILLGRDILQVHKVRQQYNGKRNDPYAQRTDLGWVIVGDVCMDRLHKLPTVNVHKTHTLPNGRASMLSPCPNEIQVKENTFKREEDEGFGTTVFNRTPQDEQTALSIDYQTFLEIMDRIQTAGWRHYPSANLVNIFLTTGGRPCDDSSLFVVRWTKNQI